MRKFNMKCIKDKCKFYFNSDDYVEICHLANAYCVSGECVGFDKIRNKMEETSCKVSKLIAEYNELIQLEDWIRDNQFLI